MTLDELNEQMMPFAKLMGIEFTQLEPDDVRALLDVPEALCTTGSFVHGGALMALADSVGAVATFINLPPGAKGTTTIESKTNFVGGAPIGTRLIATARPIHLGGRTHVWQTKVETEKGKLVSVTIQTQLLL